MFQFNRIRRIYDFYTSDLNGREIEKLLKKDVPELYGFYVRRMKPVEHSRNRVFNKISFMKNLLAEFLNQLSPIRRLIYTITIFIFIFALFNNDWFYVTVSFAVINLLLAFELADKLTAKNELSIAREIQTSLMPKEIPPNDKYDISCYSETAYEVGGDYYDIIKDNSAENTFVIIGDISGKGMAAAIHMIQVHSILNQVSVGSKSPKEILISLNNSLKNIFNKGTFFTSTILKLNGSNTINLSRAGHMPILFYSASKNSCERIVPKGIGIGLSNNGKFDETLEQVDLKCNTGDIILLYTDGVTEAANKYNQEFGEINLEKSILSNANKSAKEIQEAIIWSIHSFANDMPLKDDHTLIVIKIL